MVLDDSPYRLKKEGVEYLLSEPIYTRLISMAVFRWKMGTYDGVCSQELQYDCNDHTQEVKRA